jgi:hypothetical protein
MVSILAILHVSADRERSARIGVFLRDIVLLVRPDFLCAHACLDRLAFAVGTPLGAGTSEASTICTDIGM